MENTKLLAYDGDIVFINHYNCALISAFFSLNKEAKRMGFGSERGKGKISLIIK